MSIFDIFTKMHLDGAADLIANHEKHVREVAEKLGLDPDKAYAEARIPKASMACPACGQPGPMTIMCRGCGFALRSSSKGGDAFYDDYGDAITRARQHILDLPVATPQIRQYAAANAFNPGGCCVCPDCIEQTLTYSAHCPLRWMVSPDAAMAHLVVTCDSAEDRLETFCRIAHLWIEVLADGETREWRHQLFTQAIPEAIRARRQWESKSKGNSR